MNPIKPTKLRTVRFSSVKRFLLLHSKVVRDIYYTSAIYIDVSFHACTSLFYSSFSLRFLSYLFLLFSLSFPVYSSLRVAGELSSIHPALYTPASLYSLSHTVFLSLILVPYASSKTIIPKH